MEKIKRFEEFPVPKSSVADLDEPLWRCFVSKREEDITAALLKRDLLVANPDGELQASVLGILMCNGEPRKFFRNAFIQAVRYRGNHQDSHYQVDAKDISGPLDRQILDALVFLRLILNRSTGNPYSHIPVGETGLHFCPQSSRSQKLERLESLFSRLRLPDGENLPENAVVVAVESD